MTEIYAVGLSGPQDDINKIVDSIPALKLTGPLRVEPFKPGALTKPKAKVPTFDGTSDDRLRQVTSEALTATAKAWSIGANKLPAYLAALVAELIDGHSLTDGHLEDICKGIDPAIMRKITNGKRGKR